MILRVAAVILLALLLAPAQLALMATPARSTIPRLFMKALAHILRLRLVVHVRPTRGAALYVANHISWLDIIVLGAALDVAFVAKAEVRSWGPVGWLATMAGTLFVDRERRRQSASQVDAVADRLRAGRPVIMFPEGGSSDGRVIRPFKSALFAAAEATGSPIQPVSLAYTRIGPLPVTRHALPLIAWLGDVPLAAHAGAFLRLPPVRAELLFHPPVHAAGFAGRKALAAHCHDVVSDGYRRLMRGA